MAQVVAALRESGALADADPRWIESELALRLAALAEGDPDGMSRAAAAAALVAVAPGWGAAEATARVEAGADQDRERAASADRPTAAAGPSGIGGGSGAVSAVAARRVVGGGARRANPLGRSTSALGSLSAADPARLPFSRTAPHAVAGQTGLRPTGVPPFLGGPAEARAAVSACGTALVGVGEDWEARCAVLSRLADQLAGGLVAVDPHGVAGEVRRSLARPLAAQLLDRRSAVCRVAVRVVVALAEGLGPALDHSAVILMPALFKVVPITVQVMAEAADEAATTIVRHVRSPRVAAEVTVALGAPHKDLRAAAAGWVVLMASSWMTADVGRGAGDLTATMLRGTEDADPRARRACREAAATLVAREWRLGGAASWGGTNLMGRVPNGARTTVERDARGVDVGGLAGAAAAPTAGARLATGVSGAPQLGRAATAQPDALRGYVEQLNLASARSAAGPAVSGSTGRGAGNGGAQRIAVLARGTGGRPRPASAAARVTSVPVDPGSGVQNPTSLVSINSQRVIELDREGGGDTSRPIESAAGHVAAAPPVFAAMSAVATPGPEHRHLPNRTASVSGSSSRLLRGTASRAGATGHKPLTPLPAGARTPTTAGADVTHAPATARATPPAVSRQSTAGLAGSQPPPLSPTPQAIGAAAEAVCALPPGADWEARVGALDRLALLAGLAAADVSNVNANNPLHDPSRSAARALGGGDREGVASLSTLPGRLAAALEAALHDSHRGVRSAAVACAVSIIAPLRQAGASPASLERWLPPLLRRAEPGRAAGREVEREAAEAALGAWAASAGTGVALAAAAAALSGGADGGGASGAGGGGFGGGLSVTPSGSVIGSGGGGGTPEGRGVAGRTRVAALAWGDNVGRAAFAPGASVSGSPPGQDDRTATRGMRVFLAAALALMHDRDVEIREAGRQCVRSAWTGWGGAEDAGQGAAAAALVGHLADRASPAEREAALAALDPPQRLESIASVYNSPARALSRQSLCPGLADRVAAAVGRGGRGGGGAAAAAAAAAASAAAAAEAAAAAATPPPAQDPSRGPGMVPSVRVSMGSVRRVDDSWSPRRKDAPALSPQLAGGRRRGDPGGGFSSHTVSRSFVRAGGASSGATPDGRGPFGGSSPSDGGGSAGLSRLEALAAGCETHGVGEAGGPVGPGSAPVGAGNGAKASLLLETVLPRTPLAAEGVSSAYTPRDAGRVVALARRELEEAAQSEAAGPTRGGNLRPEGGPSLPRALLAVSEAARGFEGPAGDAAWRALDENGWASHEEATLAVLLRLVGGSGTAVGGCAPRVAPATRESAALTMLDLCGARAGRPGADERANAAWRGVVVGLVQASAAAAGDAAAGGGRECRAFFGEALDVLADAGPRGDRAWLDGLLGLTADVLLPRLGGGEGGVGEDAEGGSSTDPPAMRAAGAQAALRLAARAAGRLDAAGATDWAPRLAPPLARLLVHPAADVRKGSVFALVALATAGESEDGGAGGGGAGAGSVRAIIDAHLGDAQRRLVAIYLARAQEARRGGGG